jgi:peptide/nickel transport system substrate-binding protein
MRFRSVGTMLCLLAGVAALAVAAVALPAGAQDSDSARKVLKIGWAQDVQTLNPFVAQDEENFRVWAINWDLLVNFSPDDLSPAPGIAQSWDVSPDRRTVTFKLVEGARWSDGRPITSRDVKYSLDVLGGNGLIFSGYTDNISSIETPDDRTVVIKTTQPDARIVGGLFVYIIPEHVYGETSVRELTGAYQPEVPLVGSGPFIVTEFDRGRILRMERNPRFRGPRPEFDEIQFIKYGTTDAVSRALRLGEIDAVPEVEPTGFNQLEGDSNIETVRSSSPSFTELAFNLCSEEDCPEARFNPGVQDRAVRQAVAYAVDRERVNEISSRGTSFPAHGLLPSYYKTWYEEPSQDYPYNPDRANQILDDAGYTREGDGVRRKGDVELSFDLFVRSESPSDTQAAKIIAEQAREVGIEFKVQVISVDRLTEITTRKVDGVPAPEFDSFVWGWGGDPYDPSALLKLITTSEIGSTSDSFYSNPEYDRLYREQTGEFDPDRRKELVQRMIAIAQRDLPYLVLTEDPYLEAYRADRLSNVERVCPRPDGEVLCREVSYAPLLTLAAGDGDGGDGGGGAAIIAVVAVAILGVAAFLVVRARRRRRGPGPIEIET